MEGAATFVVTNFVWASSYVLGALLGEALVDPRDNCIVHPSLTVVCLIMLLLPRRVA